MRCCWERNISGTDVFVVMLLSPKESSIDWGAGRTKEEGGQSSKGIARATTKGETAAELSTAIGRTR